MKRILILIVALIVNSTLLFPQVAINTTGTDPNPAAMLDVSSSSLGVLIPRLTTVQRTAIPTPPEGLLLYDTDTKSFWFVKNSTWTEITNSSSTWSLNGNSGTDTAVNFIGTIDNQPLKLKVNNQLAGWLDPSGNANTGFGYQSLTGITTGTNNTALGYNSLLLNSTGGNNTATGSNALHLTTTGTDNAASGAWTLYENRTGYYNSAAGAWAMHSNTTGFANSAIGTFALFSNATGSNNSAIGMNSLYYSNGSDNTASGAWSLHLNQIGSGNTAIGTQSLFSNISGNNNTAIGDQAGYYLTGGNGNIFIGTSSGPASNQSIDSTLWLGRTRSHQPVLFVDLTDGRIGIGTTTPDASAKLEVNSSNQGFLPPRMTFEQRNAIVNPAEGLVIICTNCTQDGNAQPSLYLDGQWKTINLECNIPLTPTAGNHADTFTEITWNWNSVPIAVGYKWNNVNDYASAIDVGMIPTRIETGLFPGDICTRFVWAYNNCGHSSSVTLQDTTICYAPGSGVTDIDGTYYPTTILGAQEWMRYNLWTTRYNNGDSIPCVNDSTQWTVLNTGARCNSGWYTMYNWYAISDPREICPTGWHVPTDAEWTVLINYLGGNDNNAAGKLLYEEPSFECATDISKFMGWAFGFRGTDANLYGNNQSAMWWSSTQVGSDTSIVQRLNYWWMLMGCTEVAGGIGNKSGCNVRCIKD